jgi:hypothetical protein
MNETTTETGSNTLVACAADLLLDQLAAWGPLLPGAVSDMGLWPSAAGFRRRLRDLIDMGGRVAICFGAFGVMDASVGAVA